MKSANISEVIRLFFLLPKVQEMAAHQNPRLAFGLNSYIGQAAVLASYRDTESRDQFVAVSCDALCCAVALVAKADKMIPSRFSSDVCSAIKGDPMSSINLCYEMTRRSSAVLSYLEQFHLPYSKVAVVISSLIEVGNSIGINLVEHMDIYAKAQNS